MLEQKMNQNWSPEHAEVKDKLMLQLQGMGAYWNISSGFTWINSVLNETDFDLYRLKSYTR